MKKSFTLAALLLVLSTGLFAAAPAAKTTDEGGKNNFILQSLRTALGFGISIQDTKTAQAIVTITDKNERVILSDNLAQGKSVEKGYNLSELETGDYKLVINADNEKVIKTLHVYEEYGNKTYVFLQ
jgi:hypothetical protein